MSVTESTNSLAGWIASLNDDDLAAEGEQLTNELMDAFEALTPVLKRIEPYGDRCEAAAAKANREAEAACPHDVDAAVELADALGTVVFSASGYTFLRTTLWNFSQALHPDVVFGSALEEVEA